MAEAELTEAFVGLERGYCLWVGAGLTRQVAGSSGGPPLWGELTAELEAESGVTEPARGDFPTRLERCLKALGRTEFRSFLRRRYWTELCVGVLAEADDLLDAGGDDVYPDRLTALSALGHLANPIVNFNIEWLSSVLLARPAAPFQLAFDDPAYAWREPSGRFQRRVQHPHGLADTTTVMTNSEYAALEHSLAFGVAIHGAFSNQLVIVGMSLDDVYLREQIERYRRNIGPIYWFNSDVPTALADWAHGVDITLVRMAWPDFWAACASLPVAVDGTDLATAWYLAVDVAADEARGGAQHGLLRSLAAFDESPAGLAELAERLAQEGAETGETGESIRVNGKQPHEIELRLRDRLIADGVALPRRHKTFS